MNNNKNVLRIKLNQDYKQFKNGFEYEFNGELIILSGVNGSGKSQLMDIINMSKDYAANISSNDLGKYKIMSTIDINGYRLSKEEVFKQSFKNNFLLNNITMPNPKNSYWHKDEAWKAFSNLNQWKSFTTDYSKSKKHVEECLAKNGRRISPDFNNNMKNNTNPFISESDFKNLLPNDFLWEKDDLFSNKIDDLFFDFAAKRHDTMAEYGMKDGGFNNDEYIKDAPWTILNELFEKLRFNYRFKTDYEFEMSNLKEKPILYPVMDDGNLDYNSPREVEDLSDGEKSIISLTFASLNEKRRPMEKLVVLDEFDNTLNPSLIESLYVIIKEYFINKGITVVMTTHSPVTISLAPEYASFYEIFKQDNDSPKIIRVNKYEYSELEVANKQFYRKLQNQKERIEMLEKQNEQINYNRILFVEDKYIEIYKIAWLKINGFEVTKENLETSFDNNSVFKICSKQNKDSLKGFISNPFMDEWNGKYIVGLFDFDDAYNCYKNLKERKGDEEWDEEKGAEEFGLYITRKKYPNISALMLPVPVFRESIANTKNSVNRLEVELLFEDQYIEQAYNGQPVAYESVIGDIKIPKIKNKEKFWIKIIDLPVEAFNNFKPLFNIVNKLLNVDND